MYTFILSILVLIVGYIFYGKLVERIVGIDEKKETPAYALNDGVDYVPMDKKRLFLIHFLNIAGLGPIFGAIQGALFGPAAFLWIVFGSLFAGCIHDFFSGYLSVKFDGGTMPGIISKYLGNNIRKLLAVLTVLTCTTMSAVFALGSANLLTILTNINPWIWTSLIFVYFLIATLFPIDKTLGKIYPIFGFLFLLMALVLVGALVISPTYHIPELTAQGLYFSSNPIFPFLFITIACGAISGFHSSQSPIVARCVKNEKDMRFIFYGAMVLEGIVALIWAAITMAFFNGQPQLAYLYGATPYIGVKDMSIVLAGTLGLVLTIIGVVICPVTSGGTALRSARITIADELSLNQKKLSSRLKIVIPLFAFSFGLTFINFDIVWRYFAWLQLIVATLLLWASTVYLIDKKRNYIISIAPAIFTTAVSFAYILQASEGLRIDPSTSNVIAVIATIAITVLFIYKYKLSGTAKER